MWTVGACTITVVELPDVRGEELELSCVGGELTLVVDGEPHDPADAPAPCGSSAQAKEASTSSKGAASTARSGT